MKNKNAFLSALIVLSLLFQFSCDKKPDHGTLQQGKLQLGGLAGCGWLIRLSDSTILEPINLDDFDIELSPGKTVYVAFFERTDMGSICMTGKIVELEHIEE